jgi:beta-xylosidase
VIGSDPVGDATGEPVMRHKKPNVGKVYPIRTPQDSDEFNGPAIGPQWQWQANADARWGFAYPKNGVFRMFSVQQPDGYRNLWDLPNLLLQKMPAEEFTATAKVRIDPRLDGERFGLVIMGIDYSYIGVTSRGGKLFVSQSIAKDADKGSPENETLSSPLSSNDLFLRVTVAKGAICTFSYSTNGREFTPVGEAFKAREGRWIGAKVGFFFTRQAKFNDAGSADIDWFRFER